MDLRCSTSRGPKWRFGRPFRRARTPVLRPGAGKPGQSASARKATRATTASSPTVCRHQHGRYAVNSTMDRSKMRQDALRNRSNANKSWSLDRLPCHRSNSKRAARDPNLMPLPPYPSATSGEGSGYGGRCREDCRGSWQTPLPTPMGLYAREGRKPRFEVGPEFSRRPRELLVTSLPETDAPVGTSQQEPMVGRPAGMRGLVLL